VSRDRGKHRAAIGIQAGAVWVIVVLLWRVITGWQDVEQLLDNMPRFIAWLASPLAGAVLTIGALLVYAVLWVLGRNPPAAPLTLVGKFFHTFHPNGDFQYQGQVLREENGRLFVQLYGPLFGEASTQQFLTYAEAASARFYDADDEWREEGQRLQRRDANR
jgi:hypothetical protein